MGPVLDLDVIGLPDAVRMLRARVPDLDHADRGADRRGAGPAAAGAGAGRRLAGPLPDARPGVPGAAAQPGRRPVRPRPGQRPAATRSPRCGRSAWAASPPRTRPRYNCWASAPTWRPSRSRWICSPPTRTCCPSRCRRPPLTGWPSLTLSRCWSITPWPSGPRPGCSCTGSCRPPSAPATAAPHARPQRRHEMLPRWLRRRPGRRWIRWRWRCGVLRADAPAQITGAPQDWPRWAVLLPHVLAATGHAGHAGRQPGPAVMTDAVVAAGPGRNLPAGAGAAHRREGTAGTRAGHR